MGLEHKTHKKHKRASAPVFVLLVPSVFLSLELQLKPGLEEVRAADEVKSIE